MTASIIIRSQNLKTISLSLFIEDCKWLINTATQDFKEKRIRTFIAKYRMEKKEKRISQFEYLHLF